MDPRRLTPVASLALALSACSSTYVPAQNGRIALTMQNGKQVLVKNGHAYPMGGFGGALEDAVAGNAAAEEEAHEFSSKLTTGFALSMLSIAPIGLGATMTAVSASSSHEVSIPGVSLLAAGLVLYVAGTVFLGQAPPHFYDAINLYNDGVDRGAGRERGAPPPTPAPLPPTD